MPVTDLLYLDRRRLRRLLGELEGGVVESVVSQLGATAASRATARLFADLDVLPGQNTPESGIAETISVDDALLQLAEEAFSRAGVLQSIDGIEDPASWQAGKIHDQVRPAALIRTSATTQIMDPEQFSGNVDRLMSAVETFAKISKAMEPDGPVPRGAGQKKAMTSGAVERAASELLGGVSPASIREMVQLIGLLSGGHITLRQLPCGPEHRRFALAGILDPEAGALLENRRALHAKYGARPSMWTVLAQVAAVPRQFVDESEDDSDDGDGDFDLSTLENLANTLMIGLESSGLTGGPAWPTITVTPLAVFRRSEEAE